MTRLTTLFFAMLLAPGVAIAQPATTPNLSRLQRMALQAVVAGVDAAAPTEPTPALDWPVHLLRASDGSHYVAFRIIGTPAFTDTRPVVLYVRLATVAARHSATVERSAVADWLAGRRSTLPPQERGLAIGDMPAFGAGAISSRGQPTQDLRLLERRREQAQERREQAERERKAALAAEGGGAPVALLPFEDFDLAATPVRDSAGRVTLQRSLTAGPGDYELTIGWTDSATKNRAPEVHVLKRRLSLPVAPTTAFGLSSVIVADAVVVRTIPFSAAQQTAHPYSLGTTEVVPASDSALAPDDDLKLFVQVINPRGAADGKPDVVVGFKVFRATAAGEQAVGTLTPQIYNQTTLPADFSVVKGHPIFAAVKVPMKTFTRGTYRVQVLADDRVAGASATADTAFTVTATTAMLLADAPMLAPAFRRERLVSGPLLEALVDSLEPAKPSAPLRRALTAARERRFIELIQDDQVDAPERGVRGVIRALGLFAVGDTPTGIAVALRDAEVSTPGVEMLLGALRALEGNDRDAAAAWQRAIAAGFPASAAAPLLIDALIRQGDVAGAAQSATTIDSAARADDGLFRRRLASALLAAARTGEAIDTLEDWLGRHPDDQDAQWLLLHALFQEFVAGRAPATTPTGRLRFRALVDSYVAAGGVNAALAREWATAMP
ncbi:MAG TPA: hypothetical protein VNJ02_16280 [Vicinamibacterales bacterium]|nr:hypothetical protein [Vicinamibacterales bacterium]